MTIFSERKAISSKLEATFSKRKAVSKSSLWIKNKSQPKLGILFTRSTIANAFLASVWLIVTAPQSWAQHAQLPASQAQISSPNTARPPLKLEAITQSPEQKASIYFNALSDQAKQNQRFIYQTAHNAVRKKQFHTAQTLLAKLQNYPLKPHIEYQLLSQKLASTPLSVIDQFLADNKGSLLADKLTGSVLYFLAEQQRWQDFNRYYTSGFSSTPMRCRSLLARHHTGDSHALTEAIPLWNVGKSQPNACDPLFKLLKTHNIITPELRWSRFDKAIQNRKFSLARYIQRAMGTHHKALAELYFQVDHNPKQITNAKAFADSSPQMQTIIAHGIRKLARSNPKLAWQHWEMYEAQRLFEAELATNTKQKIVKYLTRKGHLAEAEQLLSYSHSLRNPQLVESLIRENLESLNWAAVAKNIALLPEELKQTDRWLYWSARSHHILQTDNLDVDVDVDVDAIYSSLAAKRSWYGFLAADIIGNNYKLEDATVTADSQLKNALANDPAMQQAKELWIIGEYQQARAHWYHALKHRKTEELIAAGELAKDWGWYNSGIVAMITGNLWNHLTLRFPLAYNREIEQASVNSQLDETLIYAIARQESAFAADAVSHAGARGLMQLMPATAKEQARFSGVSNHRTQDLFTPGHNIHLGSAYLSKLLREFNGNRILATAAYNAGKNRVKRWLKTPQAETPADVWVEVIPFKETRQYVQNVLTYSVIYEYRIASINALSAQADYTKQQQVNIQDHLSTTSNNASKNPQQNTKKSWQKSTLLRAQEAKIAL